MGVAVAPVAVALLGRVVAVGKRTMAVEMRILVVLAMGMGMLVAVVEKGLREAERL